MDIVTHGLKKPKDWKKYEKTPFINSSFAYFKYYFC